MNQPANNNGIGRIFAAAALAAVAITVLIFLGLHSINFFTYMFKDDQQYFAWLGFGLTGGAFIAYIADLKWYASTTLQKGIAVAMIFICLAGELATAGFGMQLEAFKNAGLSFTEQDITGMIWMVRILGVLHGIALVLHFVGDEIGAAFKGTPIDNTVFDRRAEARRFPAEVPTVSPPTPQQEPGPQPDPFRKASAED